MGWISDRGVIRWQPGDENPDHDHVDESVDKMDVDDDISYENEEGTSNPNGSGHVHENPDEHSDDNAIDAVSDEGKPLKNPNGKRNLNGIGALLAKLEALIFSMHI